MQFRQKAFRPRHPPAGRLKGHCRLLRHPDRAAQGFIGLPHPFAGLPVPTLRHAHRLDGSTVLDGSVPRGHWIGRSDKRYESDAVIESLPGHGYNTMNNRPNTKSCAVATPSTQGAKLE